MARLRASWRTSLPVAQQPSNPQSESISRTPYQDGNVPHGAIRLEAAQGRDLVEPRPILVLEHDAGRVLLDDLADYLRRHLHREGEGVVLDHEGDVGTDRLNSLAVIARDLVVGTQARDRCDHNSGCTALHDLTGERTHRSKTGRRHTDDYGQLAHPPDETLRNRNRL